MSRNVRCSSNSPPSMLPDTLDVRAALIYFHAYMYGPYQGRLRLFRDRGLKPRMVMSED